MRTMKLKKDLGRSTPWMSTLLPQLSPSTRMLKYHKLPKNMISSRFKCKVLPTKCWRPPGKGKSTPMRKNRPVVLKQWLLCSTKLCNWRAIEHRVKVSILPTWKRESSGASTSARKLRRRPLRPNASPSWTSSMLPTTLRNRSCHRRQVPRNRAKQHQIGDKRAHRRRNLAERDEHGVWWVKHQV